MTSQLIDLTDESDELAHLDLSFTHPRLNGTITPFASTDGPSMHIIRGTWKFDRGTTLPFELKQTITHASESPINGIYHGKFSMIVIVFMHKFHFVQFIQNLNSSVM